MKERGVVVYGCSIPSHPMDYTHRHAYPENENYGCVDCGSDSHTTGDVVWCRVAQAEADIE